MRSGHKTRDDKEERTKRQEGERRGREEAGKGR